MDSLSNKSIPSGIVTGETEFIVFKCSDIHGTGGFARVNLLPDQQVIEYVGEKISKSESLRRCEMTNEYIFALDAEFDLDGNVPWNPARFLNHSCDPNCEAEYSEGRIWIVVRRPVGAGEELTFNYGYDLEDFRDHPCQCGADNCVGYMVAEEFFPNVAARAATAESKV